MNRHLSSAKTRLAITPLIAILAILAFSATASALTAAGRSNQRHGNTGSAQSAPNRVGSREALAVTHVKAVAIAKAKATAEAKAKRVAHSRFERVSHLRGRKTSVRVKVVKTTTRTKTTTQPAGASTPSATVITTTATATATAANAANAAGTHATPTTATVTATATATATVTQPVSSTPGQATSSTASPTTTPVATPSTNPTSAPAVGPASAGPNGIPGTWNLVMDSEFNSSSLNTNIWTPGWFGTGVTDPVNTAEDDCYSSNNVGLSGTSLDLNITDAASSCAGNSYPYMGSLISSQPNGTNQGFLYTYGVVEARVYIPAATSGSIANWPAVWAVTPPSETYGEDDIFEGLNGQACYHYRNNSGAPGNCDMTLTPGWHTFASNWEPGSITYYYDGTEVGSEVSTSNEPMYIILDNTTDSNHLNLAGQSTMQVQYVRVWQSNS